MNSFRRGSKYHATKTVVDGIKFDSKKEARRWLELRALESAGRICNLQRQVRFELLPSQRDKVTNKVIERPCFYVADFTYTDAKDDSYVIEDVKTPATATPVYKLKKKLLLWRYNYRVKEV